MAEHNGLDGKLMSVGEAVERFVPDGCQIAIGGFTITRNPMAAAYEIARRRIKDLHLVAHSNGQALDVLVGAGCVRRLDIAYGGNGRFAPTCIRFRKAVERGEHDEPALPRWGAGRALHPQQIGARHRRDRP
jgi:glutaconate CoA-transferase subunit A